MSLFELRSSVHLLGSAWMSQAWEMKRVKWCGSPKSRLSMMVKSIRKRPWSIEVLEGLAGITSVEEEQGLKLVAEESPLCTLQPRR